MEVSSLEIEKYLANPSLSTSVGFDWGHLTVRVRREPASCRYLRIPATPDPWLVLTTGGGQRKTEVRGKNGWNSAFSGPGNLAVTSPGKSTEIRGTAETEAELRRFMSALMLPSFIGSQQRISSAIQLT